MTITPGIRNMLLAVFFFSLMNLGAKWLHRIPAHEVVLARSIVALVISVGTLKYLGIFSFGNRKGLLMLRGLFGSTALLLFFISLQQMSFASAVTIQYLSPVFVALFGLIILKERVAPVHWLFFGLAFAGVAVIREFDSRITAFYLVLGVVSAIFSGLAYTTIRLMKDTDHPLVVVMYFPLVSLPVSLFLCISWEWVTPDAREWVVLAATGLFAQLGQIFMTQALHQEQASKVGSINFLGVIYGLFFGWMFFSEPVTLWMVLGIVMVFVAVTGIVLVKPVTKKSPRK